MKLILVLFFMTQILISQTDEMYTGVSNVSPSKNKLKTIEKTSIIIDDYIVYGKYRGVNWETGEIERD